MLTDPACKNAKPKEKPYRLSDEKGLYLEVMPNGSKYFRMKYRFGGKEKRLAFGVYPDVPLKEARQKRDEARATLAQGIDPGAQRKSTKGAQADTFEGVAREWHCKFSPVWSKAYTEATLRILERDVFPWIGAILARDITAPALLAVLRRIESRSLETAHKAKQRCGQVFDYAIATGRAERNPALDLRRALPPMKVTHFASVIEPNAIGALLRAIDGYQGTFTIRCALRLAPLVFVRPGELPHAEWAEIDFIKAEWRIPASKMKMREQHIVPLSGQALAILRDLQPLTGTGRYLFPSERTADRPISENTVNAALRRMGYGKDEMTGHGFRSMASTLLNEQGWHRDAIERQLAHAERNAVRAAYNYAEHLPERRKMMQAWADHLDAIKAGADIIPLRRKA